MRVTAPHSPDAGGSGYSLIDRRTFIGTVTGSLLAAPVAAHAQRAGRVYRVGYIGPTPVATLISDPTQYFNSFRREMGQRGYVEGQDLVLELRSVEERPDRASEVVGELVRLNPDVIVAVSAPVILTGLSQNSPELSAKRLDLLKDVVPGVSQVAILWNPTNPSNASQLRATKLVAQALGMQLQLLEVRGPQDFESGFQAATRGRAGALITLDDLLIYTRRTQIVALAAKSRLPAIYGWSKFAEAGGLMSYGPDFRDMYRQAAIFVDKILKGPSLATLLARADQVIE